MHGDTHESLNSFVYLIVVIYILNAHAYFCSDMFNNIKNILFPLILYCKLNKYFIL